MQKAYYNEVKFIQFGTPTQPYRQILSTDDGNIKLHPTRSPCGVIDATEIEFLSKTISIESFADSEPETVSLSSA